MVNKIGSLIVLIAVGLTSCNQKDVQQGEFTEAAKFTSTLDFEAAKCIVEME